MDVPLTLEVLPRRVCVVYITQEELKDGETHVA